MALVLQRGGGYLRRRSRWWRRLFSRAAGRYAAGLRGERLVAARLERLSNRFLVLHDVHLPGRDANLDHVVVGPRGVVVIETKYYAADVRGREGGDWARRAPRRGWRRWLPGGWTPVHDPTAQARRGANGLLAELARRPETHELVGAGRLGVWPLVVFAHARGCVTARTETVPVVDLRHLPRAVRRRGTRGSLDREARWRVAQAIRSLGA